MTYLIITAADKTVIARIKIFTAVCSSTQGCGEPQPANKVGRFGSPGNRKLTALLFSIVTELKLLLTRKR